MNKVILVKLKKWLANAKEKWTEELLEILWTYWCIPHSTTGKSPYNLTHKTNTLLPVEVGEPKIQRNLTNLCINNECL